MKNESSNIAGLVIVISHISLIILCGMWAWGWVEPDSFWGGIKFLVVWGIFDYIAHFIIMGAIHMLFNRE